MKDLEPSANVGDPDASSAEAQAMAWFFLQHERPLTAGELTRFQAWLAEQPEHADEYARFEQAWQDLAALEDTAAARAPARNRGLGIGAATPRAGHRNAIFGGAALWRRSGAALACGVTLAVGWASYQHVSVDFATVVNGPNQTRDLALPDGTRMHVNANTRLTVRYTLARREVRLEQGEAFIDAADERRPLTVWAGAARLTDIGTEFNVLLLPSLLEVGVRSGQVGLTPDPARSERAYALRPGDLATLALPEGELAPVPKIMHGSANAVGSWRHGVLTIQAQPLAQVVSKLAQYGGPSVLLDSAQVAGLKVSGTVDLQHPEAFWRALPALLPGLRLQWRADGAVVVSQGARQSEPPHSERMPQL